MTPPADIQRSDARRVPLVTSPPSPEFLDLQAAVAGRYSLERELGRGGMGVVFLARDVALERPVAIKLLPRHLAHDPALRERFLREARTAAQLMHPNIVPIHAVEAHDDVVCFVMAFVDGETLTQRVQRQGVLSGDDAIRVMQEVAWALSYAHARGVIHRDIKPDNILIEHASGRAMVADFGIARVTKTETLSAEGALVGTVQYMSPEQAGGEEVDGRADIYSLGATAYFALTGASPHEAPTLPAMIARLMTEEPPSVAIARTGLPSALSAVVTRALAKERAARFDSADALAAALQQGLVARREVRPEIRAFLREVHGGKVVLTGGVAVLIGAAVTLPTGILQFRGAAPLMLTLGFGAIGVFAAAIAGALGTLRGARVPWHEVDAAIDRELGDMQQHEEQQPGRMRNVRQVFAVFGGGMMGIGGVELVNAWRLSREGAHAMAQANLSVGAVATVLGFAFFVAGSWKRIPKGWLTGSAKWSTDNVTLAGIRRVMRWGPLARLYDRRVGVAVPAAPALPTATLLLQRVQELIEALPAPMRARLGDVLPAAAALERAVTALRARVARIDRSLAEIPANSPARTEFVTAREHTAARLAECVSALEQVRTDLLRLGAGLIQADGITAELEKAQELSAAIDAELHGLDAVRELGD